MSNIELIEVSASWTSAPSVGGYDTTRSISFSAEPGEWVALVGDNGIGKSTLFHAIAGTANYVSGQIRVGSTLLLPGDPFARFQAGVQMVPQSASLPHALSWAECVRLAFCNRQGVHPPEGILNDLAHQIEDRGLMESVSGRLLPDEMAARTADFVVSVLANPRVLLLDELLPAWPTSDRATAYAWIKNLVPEATVLFVDHDRVRACDAADKVLYLREKEAEEPAPSHPLVLAKSDPVLAKLLVEWAAASRVDANVYVVSEERLQWRIIRDDQPPVIQLRLALQARGYGRLRQETELRRLVRAFGFLNQDRNAEMLSGGEKVVLLSCLTHLTGIGSVPNHLYAHLAHPLSDRLAQWKRVVGEGPDA